MSNGTRRCPGCGQTLTADAIRGICPGCLMRAAMPGGASRTDASTGGSALATLEDSIGPLPRVLLRDTNPGEEPGPIVTQTRDEKRDASLRYRIDGEIARGGMGAVLKGRDPDLGRDVALKVLRDDLRGDPDMTRRFVEEAQIAGQLQHPGVVPVYELGTLADRRPFFAMKLVKGHTLAQLLDARSSPADDLPRLMSIFEAVCQTVAYAHARGVIHRDLKPSNVMVGSFGEVQVMDWGLAKVLPRGGIVDDAQAGIQPRTQTIIATARSGGDDSAELSHPGSVMGTPAYMAPEQARGELDQVDERADVFALGSILCELLTGEPAFIGRSVGEIQRKAALGDTADALARLERSGADAELMSLARHCLAREPEDRPHDAGSVAERLSAYEAGVQRRLRAAELASVEERARRRLTTVVAASAVLITALAGLGAARYVQDRQVRAGRVALALKEATLLREQAIAHPDDPARWPAALEGVRRAESTLAEGSDGETRSAFAALRKQVESAAEADRKDRELLARIDEIRVAGVEEGGWKKAERSLAEAFRVAGYDLSTLSPWQVGERIRARPGTTAIDIAAGLDGWTRIRLLLLDQTGAMRTVEAARVADPDPWRNELRTALCLPDKPARQSALTALGKSADLQKLRLRSLKLLSACLMNADPPAAETILRFGQLHYPQDLMLNLTLAMVLQSKGQFDEAIRFGTAARSIRPESAHDLAHALESTGRTGEAIAILQDLVQRRPESSRNLSCLGLALKREGRMKEVSDALARAVSLLRKEVESRPDDDIAHFNLGMALYNVGKPDEAIAELRRHLRIDPADAQARTNIGTILQVQGRADEAIAEAREALRIDPNQSMAHNNLAWAIVTHPDPAKRNLIEALEHARKAVALAPGEYNWNSTLATVLYRAGKRDEALAKFRKALELGNGGGPQEWLYLAMIACELGRKDEAERWFDKSVAWMKEKASTDPDMRRAWSEAAKMLSRPGPEAMEAKPVPGAK
ncbi:MAG: tetratricopeptide repeat protein [Isosphaeraceae bacterium]